jgi:hypothetical protein
MAGNNEQRECGYCARGAEEVVAASQSPRGIDLHDVTLR